MDSPVLLRLVVAVLSGTLACCAAAPVAAGKGRVLAHMQTPIALDAAPGSSLELAWTLRSAQAGRSQAVALSGVFVELRDAGGGRTSVGRATVLDGRYRARVAVPAGGIGAVAIGMEGTRYVGGAPGSAKAVATHAPLFFELDDDPLVAGRPATDDAAMAVSPWLLAGLGALAALLLVARSIAVRRAVT